MSGANTGGGDRLQSRLERWHPWLAALCSTLLHLLFLLLLLWSARTVLAPLQSGGGGARVKVDFIGEASKPSPLPPSPPAHAAPSKQRRPHKPVQTTLVAHSDDPVPPDAPDDAKAAPSPPAPPSHDQAEAQPRARPPAADPATSTPRHAATWGQPPGLLPRETAPENRGTGSGASYDQNYARGPGPEPNIGVGGYQIYYEAFGDTRLRNWRDQGMTEVSFPLPGIREYMVCPLEIVLRHGSGGCRLLSPYDPQMKQIGDAREVVSVVRVYHLGELVWRGPGPYR